MATLATGKAGHGSVIHILIGSGHHVAHAACGAGNIGIGTKHRSSVSVTWGEVTCKACLKKMKDPYFATLEADLKKAQQQYGLTQLFNAISYFARKQSLGF